MKKSLLLVILTFILLSTSCSNASKEIRQDYESTEAANVNSNSEVTVLPMDITEEYCDFDKDGKNEAVRIILLEGKRTSENKYSGKFEIKLYDSNKTEMYSIDINEGHDITLPKDFTLSIKDYNSDGIMDFNIGYPLSEDEYAYEFYTASDNKLRRLDIRNEGNIIKSCQKSNSYDFETIGDKLFVTYEYEGDSFKYAAYRWEDSYFMIVDYLYSPIGYTDIDISRIRNTIDKIADTADLTNEKSILDTCYYEYNWLLEHPDETLIYFFMNGDYEKPQHELEGLISSRINEKQQIDLQFNSTFNIDGIEGYSLDDIKQLKSPYEGNDYVFKEYDWNVQDNSYKLLAGGFHLDSFVLLYNETGKYLDGYIWTDKSRNNVDIKFRSKQNYIEVSPVGMGYGTGTLHFGGIWFEICRDKLIKSFTYPVYGYDSPPYTIGYTREYKLLKEKYDQETGDFEVIYELGIGLYNKDVKVGLDRHVVYRWDGINKKFGDRVYDIYDQIDKLIFSDGIEDEILNQNYEKLNSVLEDSWDEHKEENIQTITAFLVKCDKGDRRDILLKKIYDWYLEHNDKRNAEDMLDMINNELNASKK